MKMVSIKSGRIVVTTAVGLTLLVAILRGSAPTAHGPEGAASPDASSDPLLRGSERSLQILIEPLLPIVVTSDAPSLAPSDAPSLAPSDAPSMMPSDAPSYQGWVASPSSYPSDAPSLAPSDSPSLMPSAGPSDAPSLAPSDAPSLMPSTGPSASPSLAPSSMPSVGPSTKPVNVPANSVTTTTWNCECFTWADLAALPVPADASSQGQFCYNQSTASSTEYSIITSSGTGYKLESDQCLDYVSTSDVKILVTSGTNGLFDSCYALLLTYCSSIGFPLETSMVALGGPSQGNATIGSDAANTTSTALIPPPPAYGNVDCPCYSWTDLSEIPIPTSSEERISEDSFCIDKSSYAAGAQYVIESAAGPGYTLESARCYGTKIASNGAKISIGTALTTASYGQCLDLMSGYCAAANYPLFISTEAAVKPADQSVPLIDASVINLGGGMTAVIPLKTTAPSEGAAGSGFTGVVPIGITPGTPPPTFPPSVAPSPPIDSPQEPLALLDQECPCYTWQDLVDVPRPASSTDRIQQNAYCVITTGPEYNIASPEGIGYSLSDTRCYAFLAAPDGSKITVGADLNGNNGSCLTMMTAFCEEVNFPLSIATDASVNYTYSAEGQTSSPAANLPPVNLMYTESLTPSDVPSLAPSIAPSFMPSTYTSPEMPASLTGAECPCFTWDELTSIPVPQSSEDRLAEKFCYDASVGGEVNVWIADALGVGFELENTKCTQYESTNGFTATITVSIQGSFGACLVLMGAYCDAVGYPFEQSTSFSALGALQSMVPSDAPSAVPSDAPSAIPSDAPSSMPSAVPSAAPSFGIVQVTPQEPAYVALVTCPCFTWQDLSSVSVPSSETERIAQNYCSSGSISEGSGYMITSPTGGGYVLGSSSCTQISASVSAIAMSVVNLDGSFSSCFAVLDTFCQTVGYPLE